LLAIFPYVLSALSLINIVPIWMARKAILRGDWLTHRNFMVVSLGLWGLTFFLFAAYLWMRGLRVIVAVPEALFGFYVIGVVASAALLVVTLARVAKHQLLPHKLLARKTIIVWLLTCLFGVLFYPLTDAHIYPL
jgi:uncharacterized membrane protein YozB (DUF420 family)